MHEKTAGNGENYFEGDNNDLNPGMVFSGNFWLAPRSDLCRYCIYYYMSSSNNKFIETTSNIKKLTFLHTEVRIYREHVLLKTEIPLRQKYVFLLTENCCKLLLTNSLSLSVENLKTKEIIYF